MNLLFEKNGWTDGWTDGRMDGQTDGKPLIELLFAIKKEEKKGKRGRELNLSIRQIDAHTCLW